MPYPNLARFSNRVTPYSQKVDTADIGSYCGAFASLWVSNERLGKTSHQRMNTICTAAVKTDWKAACDHASKYAVDKLWGKGVDDTVLYKLRDEEATKHFSRAKRLGISLDKSSSFTPPRPAAISKYLLGRTNALWVITIPSGASHAIATSYRPYRWYKRWNAAPEILLYEPNVGECEIAVRNLPAAINEIISTYNITMSIAYRITT